MEANATAMELKDSMTVLEYMNWATVYPYSKESYELTKKCHELELLEKFIGCNQFVVENSKDLIEKGYGSSVTWMIEAAAPVNMVKMHRDAHYSAFFILEKIIRIITWPFRAIISILRKLYEKIRGGKEETKKMCDEAIKILDESKPVEEALGDPSATSSAVADAEAEDQAVNHPRVLARFSQIRANLAAVIAPSQTGTPAPAGAEEGPSPAPAPTGTEGTGEGDINAINAEIAAMEQEGQVTTGRMKNFFNGVKKALERDVTIEVPGLVTQINEIAQRIGAELNTIQTALDQASDAQSETNIQELVQLINNAAGTAPEKVGYSGLGERIQQLEQSRIGIERTVNELQKFIQHARRNIEGSEAKGADVVMRNTGKMLTELNNALTTFNAQVAQASKHMTEQMARGEGRIIPTLKDAVVETGGFLGRLFGVKKPGAGVLVDTPPAPAPAPA